MDALENIARKPPEIKTIVGAVAVAAVGAYVFAILSIVTHFAVVIHCLYKQKKDYRDGKRKPTAMTAGSRLPKALQKPVADAQKCVAASDKIVASQGRGVHATSLA